MTYRRVFRTLLAVLLLMCISSTALAAFCVSCGSNIDSSYAFCPKCGSKQPDSSSSSHQSTVPASSFAITGVTSSGGTLRVTWNDPSNNGPYTVSYMSALSNDFMSDYNATTGLWTSVQSINAKSATLSRFIPGRANWIVVFDKDNNYCTYRYNASPQYFNEFGTDVSITLKTRSGNDYTKVSSFSSSHIASHKDSLSYGAYIKLTYPMLAKARQYSALITITGPNGETIIDTLDTMELPHKRSYTYGNFFSFDWYFNVLTNYYGCVPSGVYTWSLYYDGMFVTSNTFSVT